MTIDPQYQQAYEAAPEETKRAIERYMAQPINFRDNKPLLYFVLGSGTQPYKMGKKESEYSDQAPTGKECGNCLFAFKKMVTGKIICSQIKGEIKLAGICKLWKGKQIGLQV